MIDKKKMNVLDVHMSSMIGILQHSSSSVVVHEPPNVACVVSVIANELIAR